MIWPRRWPGEHLHEFETDVPAVEIGKHEDVGAAGNRALDLFIAATATSKAASTCISPSISIGSCVARASRVPARSPADFQNQGMLGRAFRGVAEHRDARRFVRQVPGNHRGRNRDVAELLGRRSGITPQSAGTANHRSRLSFHPSRESSRRGGLHVLKSGNDLKQRPERARGRDRGAADERVRLAVASIIVAK